MTRFILVLPILLLLPFGGYAKTKEIQCNGKFSDGSPYRFEITFTASSNPTLREKSVQEDGSIVISEYPGGSRQGSKHFVPQIDNSLIRYCYKANFHNAKSKSCTEIDRRTGSFESVTYYVNKDDDTQRKIIGRGTCDPKGDSRNNKF